MTLKNIDNYDITIVNHQAIDGDSDVIEENAKGSFTVKNGKVYIIYTSDGEKTTIIARPEEVKISRGGSIDAQMVYKTDEKTSFLYRLPYGAMEMEIETQKIECSFTENGGILKISYTLSVQGEKIRNNISIEVK